MEIRTLAALEKGKLLDFLDQWDLPDGWRGRHYFRRYMDYDPSYADDNIWVAVHGDELLACAQIFPRRIRVLGHPVPCGGLGTLFTAPEHRGKRLASLLLESVTESMIERGMEISLLQAQRQDFFGARGWHKWTNERSIIRRSGGPIQSDASGEATHIEVVPFDRDRDLAAVKVIHSAYSASRSGTVVRDDSQWEASLCLGGNPIEDFLVARQDGATVAYGRCTVIGGILTITELGRLEEASVALADLIANVLEPRIEDALAPRGVNSRSLRDAAMLPAFDDLMLTVFLEHRGLSTHLVNDPNAMLRCLNLNALAERLHIALFPDEEPDKFLERILPHDSLVFWPSDRF